jgi:hypothetical protein
MNTDNHGKSLTKILEFERQLYKDGRTKMEKAFTILNLFIDCSALSANSAVEDLSSKRLPTPSFPLNYDHGGENDSFGLQGGGSPQKQADFNRGFSATLRSRLPLRKHTGCPRENSFPPGFLIHRSPRRAIPARKNWGWARFQSYLIFLFFCVS